MENFFSFVSPRRLVESQQNSYLGSRALLRIAAIGVPNGYSVAHEHLN